MVLLAAAALVACGDGSSESSDPSGPTTPPTVAETSGPAPSSDATEVAAASTEQVVTAPPLPTTEPPLTLPDAVPWGGPRFDEAIDATMTALAVGIGQPMSTSAVGPEIVLPDPVPTLGDTILGTGWVAEFDRFRDEYDRTDNVGLDASITPEELEAWQTGVGNGWRAASFSSSGSLSTSLLIDEQDQRLVQVLDTDASASGRPPLNLAWSPDVDTLPEPEWLAALPRPDDGVTTEILVARGTVTAGLGGSGFDGNVFVRFDYETDDLDRMVDYFEDGVLLGAGFTYEPEPISTARYRRDVAIGDWSGDVSIGSASADGVEYLQVIWQLTRMGS